MKLEKFLKNTMKWKNKSDIGILEKITLSIMGKNDGLHGLPQKDSDGVWSSSIVRKELNACNESHNKIYGTIQLALDEEFKESK